MDFLYIYINIFYILLYTYFKYFFRRLYFKTVSYMPELNKCMQQTFEIIKIYKKKLNYDNKY